MKTGIPFSLPYYSYECPSPICEIESYWWDHKKSADTNIWHRTLFYLVPPTVTVCTIIFWWLYHSFFCVNFLHHWTELLFSQKVFAFLAISSNVARLVRQEPNKEGKKVAGAAMIGGDPPAPSNQLTSSLSSSPLAPSFTLFHPLSLFTYQSPPHPNAWPFLLLCDWLEWTEGGAEKVPERIQVPRSPFQPPLLNVKPPVVFQAPILILSPCINRTDGALPNRCGPAQNCHWLMNPPLLPMTSHLDILETQLLLTLFQGCFVVYWQNQFSGRLPVRVCSALKYYAHQAWTRMSPSLKRRQINWRKKITNIAWMLSSDTLNCHVTKTVMNSGSQLSEV